MASEAALPGEITGLLTRWNEGDRSALTSLATLAYEDLRAIASGFLRREGRDHTLQAAGLVNELYLRLHRQSDFQATNRQHFYALAAMMMRRILQDYARRSHALKRPDGQAVRVPLHEDLAWVDASSAEILGLDQALDELEKIDERAVRIVELRYFLGATNNEAAGLLGISKATVDRDLDFAKAWIYRRLSSKIVRADL
jgi:RNA polymerase sigma factor (TIGR02999 family)